MTLAEATETLRAAGWSTADTALAATIAANFNSALDAYDWLHLYMDVWDADAEDFAENGLARLQAHGGLG